MRDDVQIAIDELWLIAMIISGLFYIKMPSTLEGKSLGAIFLALLIWILFNIIRKEK